MKSHGLGDSKIMVLGVWGLPGDSVSNQRGSVSNQRGPGPKKERQNRVIAPRSGTPKLTVVYPKVEKTRFWLIFVGVQDAAHISKHKMLKKCGPGTCVLVLKHNNKYCCSCNMAPLRQKSEKGVPGGSFWEAFWTTLASLWPSKGLRRRFFRKAKF